MLHSGPEVNLRVPSEIKDRVRRLRREMLCSPELSLNILWQRAYLYVIYSQKAKLKTYPFIYLSLIFLN